MCVHFPVGEWGVRRIEGRGWGSSFWVRTLLLTRMTQARAILHGANG